MWISCKFSVEISPNCTLREILLRFFVVFFFFYRKMMSLFSLLLLLLLLNCFSCVQLCATPETAAYQASPSLWFSRQFSLLLILKALMLSLTLYSIILSFSHWILKILPRKMTLASFSPFKFPLKLSYGHIQIREGTGNPLQSPCLENPMDGGAW